MAKAIAIALLIAATTPVAWAGAPGSRMNNYRNVVSRARRQCDGFGTTWGPGIGPPPAGCSGAGDSTAGTTGNPMGGGGGGAGAPTSTSPHAASMLGDVGSTTVAVSAAARADGWFLSQANAGTGEIGENIYGPFEAGFGEAQKSILEGLGCDDGSKAYIAGGIDTKTAEAIVSKNCGIELPRFEGGQYISLLDQCGGHTREYHNHEKLICLYDEGAAGHSTEVGEATDGTAIFGKYEDTDKLPMLDACGGHYGVTPGSAGAEVYHYHVQDSPPFTVGCLGPNDDGSLVTVKQCREFYTGCGDGDAISVTTAAAGEHMYDLWCPCYDANGFNHGEGITELAVFDTSAAQPTPAPTSGAGAPAAMTAAVVTVCAIVLGSIV